MKKYFYFQLHRHSFIFCNIISLWNNLGDFCHFHPIKKSRTFYKIFLHFFIKPPNFRDIYELLKNTPKFAKFSISTLLETLRSTFNFIVWQLSFHRCWLPQLKLIEMHLQQSFISILRKQSKIINSTLDLKHWVFWTAYLFIDFHLLFSLLKNCSKLYVMIIITRTSHTWERKLAANRSRPVLLQQDEMQQINILNLKNTISLFVALREPPLTSLTMILLHRETLKTHKYLRSIPW